MNIKDVTWRKATHSGGSEGSHCVEVAATSENVAVRDSKDPDGERLLLDRRYARSLAKRIKNA